MKLFLSDNHPAVNYPAISREQSSALYREENSIAARWDRSTNKRSLDSNEMVHTVGLFLIRVYWKVPAWLYNGVQHFLNCNPRVGLSLYCDSSES